MKVAKGIFCRVSGAAVAVCLATPAFAASAAAPSEQVASPNQAAGQGANLSEDVIIVTARREAENLQDVPVSVQVVTGSTIQKLAITQANEISKLAPGLSLTGTRPDDPVVVLRGVRWAPGSGTPATPIYLNEIAFDPANVLQSVFDVGQIEVLRGPQGTTRGAPSISGAVTLTTRRPDLYKFGGYVQGLYGSGEHYNVNGAINIPIIEGVLSVRLAGNYEQSELNRVRSVNSDTAPRFRSGTMRASVRFEPTDTFQVNAMFQRRRQSSRYFSQMAGPGSSGNAALGIPANFNGPALTVDDRRAVQDRPAIGYNDVDLFTLNASWEVFGQQLTFNHGDQIASGRQNVAAVDLSNILPGYEPFSLSGGGTGAPGYFNINEIRLSSVRGGRFFDYDVGYYRKSSGGSISVIPPVFLNGAFGAPGTLPGVVTTPNSRYILPVTTEVGLAQKFDSFYGNVQFHIGENTEFSAGLRHIRDRVPVSLDVRSSAAFVVAAPLAALGGLPCAGIPGVFPTGLVNSAYPGFCDFPLPAGTANSSDSFDNKYTKTIYNVSASHRFSSSVLAYATVGSSFRSGLPAIGVTGLPSAYLVPKPEQATSYEVGIKTDFSPRLRINADVFQIDYKGQLTQFEGVSYFDAISGAVSKTSLAFYGNVDARVRGVEVELYVRPIDELVFNAQASYAKIKSRGGVVPCEDPSRPITAANPINTCTQSSGTTLNSAAPFQATFNGAYTQSIGSIDGYVRFNANYQGRNPNFSTSTRTTSPYAIVDLFAGIADHSGAWDIGAYAKNVFNRKIELTRSAQVNSLYAPFAVNTGYDVVTTTAPREIGVVLRYAFGSR